MNAFKIMISKSKVQYLYSNNKFEEGMEALRSSGFTAIPVINEEGIYVGTVCDKDFLLKLMDHEIEDTKELLRELTIYDILKQGWNPAINISNDINDVLLLSMQQNFVPVVDDMNIFIGIITRRDIIKFLSEQNRDMVPGQIMEKVDDARKMEVAIHQLEKNVAPYEMFSKMYEAAMKEICIRIETINEILKFKYNREPLHHIESRIKTARSVMGKLAKKNLPATVENMQENLYDIAGVRVICAYINDVYEFAQYLEDQSDLRLIKRKDYIVSPKDNGYRSLHLILEVPINYIGAMKMIPVEIQFRTEPMDYWASLEHDLKYKPIYNTKKIDITKQLKKCSKALAETEKNMQNLAELITGIDNDKDIY